MKSLRNISRARAFLFASGVRGTACRLLAALAALFVALIAARDTCPPVPAAAESCPEWMARSFPHGTSSSYVRAAALAPIPNPLLPFWDIIILVPSGGSDTVRRAALRIQYARSKQLAAAATGASSALLFVLGNDARAAAAREAKEHGDIIFVPCSDHDGGRVLLSGSSTSCKVAKGVRHAVEKFSFHFLARVGDDAYFRVDAFLQSVGAAHVGRGGRLVLAFFMNGNDSGPDMAAKYRSKALPTYPGGMGFVLGYNVSAALAAVETLVGLPDGWPEDGVVGMWLQGFSADFVHTPCFHNHALPIDEGGRYMLHAPCTPSSLLVHYMTPALWERIDARTGLLECGTALEAHPVCGALHAAGYARLEPPPRLESK